MSPTQNAYVERFNGSFRRELLNAYLFNSLRQVCEQCQPWQYDYNHLRLRWSGKSGQNRVVSFLCHERHFKT